MKPFLTFTVLALTSVPALAHPGAHDDIAGWHAAADHLIGSPFHAALIVVAAAGAVAIGIALKKSRSSRTKQTNT